MTAAREDTAGTAYERKRDNKILAAAEDKRPLVERLYSLWGEMKAAGWQDMVYAPHDGTEVELIEMGSTGIFKAAWVSFGHDPLDTCGCFFGPDGRDVWPMRGVMWRPVKPSKGVS